MQDLFVLVVQEDCRWFGVGGLHSLYVGVSMHVSEMQDTHFVLFVPETGRCLAFSLPV